MGAEWGKRRGEVKEFQRCRRGSFLERRARARRRSVRFFQTHICCDAVQPQRRAIDAAWISRNAIIGTCKLGLHLAAQHLLGRPACTSPGTGLTKPPYAFPSVHVLRAPAGISQRRKPAQPNKVCAGPSLAYRHLFFPKLKAAMGTGARPHRDQCVPAFALGDAPPDLRCQAAGSSCLFVGLAVPPRAVRMLSLPSSSPICCCCLLCLGLVCQCCLCIVGRCQSPRR